MTMALFVDDRESLVPIYTLNLKLYVGAEVHHKKNHLEVFEHLKTNSSISLIIAKSSISQDETAYTIYKYLAENKLNIPLIVLGNEPKLANNARELEVTPELRALVKMVAEILGVTAEKMATLQVPEYYPIPTKHFRGIDNLICDVYKKVGESFNVVFRQGGKTDHKEIDQLEKQGTQLLYVPSKFRLKFAISVSEKILAQLANKNLTVSERTKLTDEGLQMVSDEMRTRGIQESTIQLAEESIKSITEVSQKSPGVGDLIKELMTDKLSFRFKHCQVLTYVCFHILENMEWGTKEQQDKLAFVAFYHDIALGTDEEARIHSDDELDESKLSAHQKEVVRKHAILAAGLVKDLPMLPLGAEIIIKQHHGSRTGTGMSTINSGISPLAEVFLVAEEWTHVALKAAEEGKKISNPKLLKYLRERTGKNQNYNKIIDTLDKLKI